MAGKAVGFTRRFYESIDYTQSMTKDSLIRSTKLFGIATFASRIFGLIRDSAISAYVPAAWQDIFWAGIKIPSTFRQLFAEGALSAAFIPLLSAVREKEGEAKAHEVSSAIFNWLCCTLVAVIAASILLSPWVVPLILDFPDDLAWKIPAGVYVTQMMFPFLFFIALSAWAMGVLNTYRYFFMSALAPVFYNITLIIGCVIAGRYFTDMPLMQVLSGVVVLGGFMQFVVMLPQLRQLGFFPPQWVSIRHPYVKEFMLKLAPAVFGLAIFQLNALVTQTYFASRYGEGGISILSYAQRLIQFPLGVVGVALATASFPRVSQFFAAENYEAAAKTLSQVTRYLLLLMIPSAVGLIALGHDICGAIFDRREFHAHGWLEPTVLAVAWYSAGLFSYAFVKVMVQSFQAQHDFKTPVRSGAVSVAVNIALCAFFSSNPDRYPLWTLAAASGVSSTVNALTLLFILKKSLQPFKLTPLVLYGARVTVATAVMALACFLFTQYFPISGGTLITYTTRVLVGVTVGMLTYGAAGWFLFRDDLKAVLRMK